MNKQLFAGKFEIQGEIAKGQTGTIYYGYDLELRQEVAIKIYHSHINGRVIRGKAFIEKSKPLLRLEHPNLIKIFKVEEEDGTPVVFMEFFEAPSLQHVIHQEGPLPVGKMLLLAREIAEVLVHTHFQGIIHGTLHPGHVLIGPQGQIKVMDLGLSWILMDILSNCDVELLRPLPYLIPELAKGELLNVSSDLYCLGFMMYDMLTKRVPYSGLPKTSIMGKLAFDQADPDFDFPDGVPEAICELIRQMTRNKSQHRLQDATHVLTILNQQLAKIVPDTSNPSVAPVEIQQAQESPKDTIKSPVPQPPAQAPDPTPNHSRVVNRPKHSVDYQGIHRGNFRKKLGLTFATIVLLIGAPMGYWYKELIGVPLPSTTTELTHPNLPLMNQPAPPINSSATIHTQIPISPPQTISRTEQEQKLKVNGLQNVGIVVRPENSRMLNVGELENVGAPSRSAQENTTLKSPITVQQSDPDTNPVPEPATASRLLDSSNTTDQPFGKHNPTPASQTALKPNPSSTLTETRQEALSGVSKEPTAHSEIPSEASNEKTKGIQESTPAFPTTGPAELLKDKELKNFLDSLEASEPASVPKDAQIPLRQAPSAISFPESSQ